MGNARRGEMVRLGAAPSVYWIGFSWETEADEMDTDLMAFILDETGKIYSVQDVVFYNNQSSGNGSVTIAYLSDQTNWEFSVDFSKLPESAQGIVFVLTIYQAKERKQSASQIKNLSIAVQELKDASRLEGKETASCVQECGNPPQELLIVCEFRRISGSWFFVPLYNGFDGDLISLCKHYGLEE